MTQHTLITRFIVELEDATARRLSQLIAQHLEPDQVRINEIDTDYRSQLAAWRAKSEALAKQYQGAPGSVAGRIRQIAAAHNSQRPRRPVGRPRSKIRQTEIFKARNAILTKLILAMKLETKTPSKKSRGKNITANTPVAQIPSA